ncbi:acyltransferase [Anaerococcus vaginalis]|uniref:acyltransferase n=1 Tax=Anaerococcus vaginalis TaxID=33037 RepID=UPI00242C0536|nr:acyltransferase [Anaerococcus vaginalis]MDU5560165.1 acyltransferase [Anaerococcus vaginalis]MDU5987931.1 acyltransferase [Anaerococcus vaginalis]
MAMQSSTKMNFGLSYCRAIATIAIIILHTGFVLSTNFRFNIEDNIILRLFVNCSMWAVPIFLMVTGVLNLDENKNLTLKKLIKKYIGRILLSIVIFVAIYQIADIIIDKRSLHLNEFLTYLKNLYTGNTYSPMWYLYMLIGLYLLMPMYRAFVKVSKENEIKFIMLVYIIFISIIPAIGTFKFKSGFYIHELTIYPFYLFMGYSLHKGIIKIDKNKGAILFIVSSILISILTYYRWINNNENFEIFWSYSSIIVIVQSIGFFNFVMGISKSQKWQAIEKVSSENKKSYKNTENIFSSILLKIDSLSFGIYLIHIIIIRIFTSIDTIKNLIIGNSILLTVPVLVITNLFLSCIIVKLIKNFPIFKSIL